MLHAILQHTYMYKLNASQLLTKMDWLVWHHTWSMSSHPPNEAQHTALILLTELHTMNLQFLPHVVTSWGPAPSSEVISIRKTLYPNTGVILRVQCMCVHVQGISYDKILSTGYSSPTRAIKHIADCRNLLARETVKATAQDTFKCNQFSTANNDGQPKFGGL